MATTSRTAGTSLAEQLDEQPYQFEFFQAVRLLEYLRRERVADGERRDLVAVGEDGPFLRESVRFRVLPSHTFPACEITSLEISEATEEEPAPMAEMQVAFMGLIGPSGVLPQHYTQTVIDRVRNKDHSLRDFLDVFHHRLISLFYRAWEKYRLPFVIERSALDDQKQAEDLFTRCLYSLVGLGTDGLRGRLLIPDSTFLYYAGHFSHHPRTVTAVESIVSDYFELPTVIEQFQGQWLYLESDDRSCMPSQLAPHGQNRCLGTNVVVGRRVWSVENRFRIRLGPLSYKQFRQFMPTGDALIPLCQLVRSYVGPEFDFDVQPLLCAEETPRARLGGKRDGGSFLGWNAWVQSKARTRDADEAVFEHDGFPTSL